MAAAYSETEDQALEAAEPEGEAEAPRRGPTRILLWTLAAAMLLFLIPLYLVSITVKDAIPAVDAELTAIADTLAAPVPISEDQQALETELLNLRTRLSGLQPQVQSALNAHVDWPYVMAAIGSYDPLRVTLRRTTQTGRQIIVEGQAQSQTAVTEYADLLRASGLFARVVIQSIDAVVLPTATPVHPDEVPPFAVTVAQFSLILEILPPSTEVPDAAQ